MSKIIDTEYYAERAREERRRAETATHPRAIAVHTELASLYEGLASIPNLDLPTIKLPRLQAIH